jgi:hypothetical protein
VWLIDVYDSKLSGVRARCADADVLRFSIDAIPESEQPCANRARPEARPPDTNQSSPARSNAILESIGRRSPEESILHARGGIGGWSFPPYKDVVYQLKSPDIPFCVIVSMAADRALVCVYFNERIAFIAATFEEARDATSPDTKQERGNPNGNSPVGRPLIVKSFGSAETSIDTWSTACWIDDALHLVSDDGKYERFIIKDDKVVRAGQLTDLGAPAAICQGKSHLWVLTELEGGAVAAQEITWNQQGEPAKSKRELGRVTLDQAAMQVLSAERDVK